MLRHSSRRRVHDLREQPVVHPWDFWPRDKFLGGSGAVTIVSVAGFRLSFLISDRDYENQVPA